MGDMLERRTVALMVSVGYRAERVARRGRYGTKDLFGVADIVAVDAAGVHLVQVTTKSGASHRRRRIRDAKLPVPVRLFKWEKVRNRWVAFSETVEPVEQEEAA
jgi:hypothetical protein